MSDTPRNLMNWREITSKVLIVLVGLAFLYLVWGLYLLGEPLFAVIAFAIGGLGVTFFWSPQFYQLRFVYPGIAAVFLFILLPVLYTSGIGFTNYGARNLLSLERVQNYHLSQTDTDAGSKRAFGLVEDGTELRIFLPENDGKPALLTGPIKAGEVGAEIALTVPETLPVRAAIQNRDILAAIKIVTPDGIILSMSGLRDFAASQPAFTLGENGVLISTSDNSILTPNPKIGFYETVAGDAVSPG